MIDKGIFDRETKNISFDMCGNFVSKGEWIHPRRTNNTYEIIFVLSGKVYMCEENKNYILEKDDILILSPEKEHFGFRSSREVSFFWLHFKTDAKLLENRFHFSDTAQLLSFFRTLLHIRSTPFYPSGSCEDLTCLIINEISFLSKKVERSDNAAYMAAEYVTANIRLRLSVSDVACHLGYNPDYLCRLFKSVFGKNLKSYIAEETVKRAKTMLSEPASSPGYVAAKLGFESENLFSKFFKYHEGITPSKYISLCYNTHINHK